MSKKKEPKKKEPKKKTSKEKWGKDKGKIYKTTDGFFNGRFDIDKKRRVVVVDQRKDDGALAVAKIHSKEGKSGDSYINNFTLTPEKHSSLTEDSIVEKHVIVGQQIKTPDGVDYKKIKPRNLKYTGDKLDFFERRKLKKGVSGDSRERKKKYKKKMKNWHNHFKDK